MSLGKSNKSLSTANTWLLRDKWLGRNSNSLEPGGLGSGSDFIL